MTRESPVGFVTRSRRWVSTFVLCVAALATSCAGAGLQIDGASPGKNIDVFVLVTNAKLLEKFKDGSDVLNEELQAECREWARLSRVQEDGKWTWQRVQGSSRSDGISFETSAESDQLQLSFSRGYANDKHVAVLLAVDADGRWSGPTAVKPEDLEAGKTLQFRLEVGSSHTKLARK